MRKVAALAFVVLAILGVGLVGAPPARAAQVVAVACASHQYRYQECRIAFNRPFLLLTKSASACVANESWGYNWHTGTVWVARGCQGVFADADDYRFGRDYYRGVHDQYGRQGYGWERGNYSDPPPRTYVDPEYHFNTTTTSDGAARSDDNTRGSDDTGPHDGRRPDTGNDNAGGFDDSGAAQGSQSDTANDNSGGYDETGAGHPDGGPPTHPDTAEPGGSGNDAGPNPDVSGASRDTGDGDHPDRDGTGSTGTDGHSDMGQGNNGAGDETGDTGGDHPQ